ncbi:DUF397 domain-containing protein [Streptomyces diastatochromogenes]|uniref:DUF397 domain-containing protein n=1 Tax=Streptomyces diastatochromogenes TaxID=42236 RepID=A0A233SI91_STRDA|nr:DUF397 domain-containing protein [Streptomyces diastatochromogenes]MCZ0988405.1 DUF397 domain-containing protein [Streptomyces diastatochromogenes]OXY95368.1 DUF397 domain-containing protein [Streptomyces diastatochromogenes]
MSTSAWQKSSYCGEGEACIHIAAAPGTIHITESADPSGAILTATPADFGALLAVLKKQTHRAAPIEVTVGEEGTVRLRETSTPDTVVTTDRRKWKAFVLGVQAGEFDHFLERAVKGAAA